MAALPIWKLVVIAWVFVSVGACAIENFVFYVRLVCLGARPPLLWAGAPRYLDKVYRRWLRENQQSVESNHWLKMRKVLRINMLLSVAALLSIAALWLIAKSFGATANYGPGIPLLP